MLILSCDLVIDENGKKVIDELADLHRINNATVTMLITPALTLSEGSPVVPGGRAQQRIGDLWMFQINRNYFVDVSLCIE